MKSASGGESLASPENIPIDSFLELVRSRRSVRSGFLKNAPVSDEHIEKILEAARWAPSGGNSQPWEFVVIRDPEIRDKITGLYKAQMRDKIEIEETVRGRRSIVDPGLAFRYAPVFVVVLGDPRTIDAYPVRTKLEKWESHFYSSLANCVLQLMLAAHVLGLTTIYVSDVSSPYFSVMIKSLLNIPDPLQVYQLVPVGFGEKSPTIHHPRRPLKDIVHHEKYDSSLFRNDAQVQTFMEEMSIRGRQYRF